MLESTHNLIGFSLSTQDGETGTIKDFYFDDQNWNIRYLVVETGNWLFGRKVLISPNAIDSVAWDSNMLNVNMTNDQVKSSPAVDTDLPVSKQMEKKLDDYYAWPQYGRAGLGYPTTGMIKVSKAVKADAEEDHADRHLRSYKHVRDYKVYNLDGFMGEAVDFLLNTRDWTLPYLLVGTPDALAEDMFAVPTNHIASIDFSSYAVSVTLGTANYEKLSTMNLNPE